MNIIICISKATQKVFLFAVPEEMKASVVQDLMPNCYLNKFDVLDANFQDIEVATGVTPIFNRMRREE